MSRLQTSLYVAARVLAPSSEALDTPLGPPRSLAVPGVCYSALRCLPRRDLHPLETNSVKQMLLAPASARRTNRGHYTSGGRRRPNIHDCFHEIRLLAVIFTVIWIQRRDTPEWRPGYSSMPPALWPLRTSGRAGPPSPRLRRDRPPAPFLASEGSGPDWRRHRHISRHHRGRRRRIGQWRSRPEGRVAAR